MPKEPTQADFECTSCGRKSTADARMAAHLLPFKRNLPIDANGLCRHCGGGQWNISVIFAETSTDATESLVGLGLAATTGIGFIKSSTASNCFFYPDVQARIVAVLNETPAARMTRVGEFVRAMERENLKARGAQECPVCGALFQRVKERPWNELGYCSKMCLIEAKGASSLAPSSTADKPAARNSKTIHVQCASGHPFDVPISFAGMVRPCPHCGQKTLVVESPFATSPNMGPSPNMDVPSGIAYAYESDAERVAGEFLAATRNDRYRERIFDFAADHDLSRDDQMQAFRALERCIKSEEWRLKFTSIEVVSGIEDNATVYFCGSRGGWLVLLAGYHYDVKQWKLDAYETSDRSFSRPGGESFAAYTTRAIREAKTVGRPYVRQMLKKDGSYYIEH